MGEGYSTSIDKYGFSRGNVLMCGNLSRNVESSSFHSPEKLKNHSNSIESNGSSETLYSSPKSNSDLSLGPSTSPQNIENKNINIDIQKILAPTKEETETEKEKEQIISKNEENLRKSYFAKLIYKNILTTKKSKTHNTIFIYDWDDTLLCTTFLTPNGYYDENMKVSRESMHKIAESENYVYELLSKSIQLGAVYIITNSGPGWVEYSCKTFYPRVFSLLEKINIQSARGDFELAFPGDNRMWKILAFNKILNDIDINLVTNLICVGDSLIEIEAGENLASKFEQAFIKTIKFREKPKIEELNKQLCLVCREIDSICSSVKNLTIKVEKKKKSEL